MSLRIRILGAVSLLASSLLFGQAPSVTVTQNTGSVGLYGIYELTLTHSGSYANPWEDVDVNVTFTSPGGTDYQVGGFYYDTNTWKVRFAPRQTGAWTWSLSFATPGGSSPKTGGFTAVSSSRSGFLRIHQGNKYRLYTEGNNKPFYPIGFSDHVSDFYNSTTGLNDSQAGYTPDGKLDWSVGADPIRTPTTSDDYFGTAASEGKNNMFRHNGEFMPDLLDFNVNGSGKNTYRVDYGKLKDEMAAKLHQYGFKTMWAFYGFPTWYVPNYSLSNATARQAWLKAHQYIINRWGAYIDIWELMNEGSGVPASYYDTVTSYIKSNDPYQHPITTSFEPAVAHPNLTVNAPHLYYDTPTYASNGWSLDNEIVNGTYGIANNKSKYPNRPQVWGEVGNRGATYSNYNPERYRIYLWTYFFNEASPLFWNTSWKKGYFGSLNNMYIGTEERKLSTIHAGYVADFDPLARPVSSVVVSNSKVHAYLLMGSQEVGGYFINAVDRNTISGATVAVTVPASGLQGRWINPSTGTVISTFTPVSGTQTLTIPAFSADIVLRINGSGGVSPSPCDITGDGTLNIEDVNAAVAQALGTAGCSKADVQPNGRCDVVDVQRIINAANGGPCRVDP